MKKKLVSGMLTMSMCLGMMAGIPAMAASEEAAAEPATEDAVLEAEEPQAVRAAAAPAIPAAARKLRREILVLFMISAPVFKMNLCI